jgi:hypothetical protein
LLFFNFILLFYFFINTSYIDVLTAIDIKLFEDFANNYNLLIELKPIDNNSIIVWLETGLSDPDKNTEIYNKLKDLINIIKINQQPTN